MKINYARIAKDAATAIANAGAPGVLRRVLADTGTYNPATASVTPPAEIMTACTAVVVPAPKRISDNESWQNGTLVRKVDMAGYIAVVGVDAPKTGDMLVWGGVTYVIAAVQNLAPAGTSVLYTVGLTTP